MSRALVLGKSGQLGTALREANWPSCTHPYFVGRGEFDLQQLSSLEKTIDKFRPDVVINAAAYTAVDQAEAEPAQAWQANAAAPGILAAAAARHNAAIVHFSTDYVFDGSKSGEWRENDLVGPLGIYGASKAAGEQLVAVQNPRHLIVRVSWLYSPWGSNFVKTILRLGRERESLSIVNDQIGRPTSALDLAEAVLFALEQSLKDEVSWGLYHFSNSGSPVSWFGFAEAIFDKAIDWKRQKPHVAPISSESYPTLARRPANSVLSIERFEMQFGFRARAWDQALVSVLDQLMGCSLPIR